MTQDHQYQGPTKRMAKRVLTTMNKILPDEVYLSLYDPAFDVYRRLLRANYRRLIERDRRNEDLDAVLRGELVHLVMPYSLVGASGLERTYDLAFDLVTRGVEGAFVECGVARGGCAALIATVAAREGHGRHCWFFDSYEGLPNPTADDFEGGETTGEHVRPLPEGSCLGTYEEVSKLLFSNLSLSRDNISMVKGWFEDTLPTEAKNIGKIALLRLDGDWYDSTMCCYENLFDQVVAGGHIIVDDYFSCHGAKKATDEFLERKGLDLAMVPDGRGGCSYQLPTKD